PRMKRFQRDRSSEDLDQMNATRVVVGHLIVPAIPTMKFLKQDPQLSQKYLPVAIVQIQVDGSEASIFSSSYSIFLAAVEMFFDLPFLKSAGTGFPASVAPPQVVTPA